MGSSWDEGVAIWKISREVSLELERLGRKKSGGLDWCIIPGVMDRSDLFGGRGGQGVCGIICYELKRLQWKLNFLAAS